MKIIDHVNISYYLTYHISHISYLGNLKSSDTFLKSFLIIFYYKKSWWWDLC